MDFPYRSGAHLIRLPPSCVDFPTTARKPDLLSGNAFPLSLVSGPPCSVFSRPAHSGYPALTAPETRASIARGFPAVPVHWISICSERLSGSHLSGGERARRAWLAGCWAGATRDGRVASPNRTPAIDLGNKIYVVIRCTGLDCPRIFSTSRSFHAAVGSLDRSDTICHGWPSDIEATIYLEGAGEAIPEPLQQ